MAYNIYSFAWVADYLFGLIFRTHRLDVVEFSPLPEGAGTQMLWKNPPGFHTRSGEFVRVQVPWLDNGGKQWHPFSIYLKEATKEGMDEVKRRENGRVFVGEDSKGGRHINLQKTGLLLIEFQNEFAHPNGGLYNNVKDVMKSTNIISNVKNLVATARAAGVPIIHAPITVAEDGSGSPNAGLGILKAVKNGKFFLENTWNSQIIDELRPELGDKIVEGKKGLDSFPGSNLEDILIELGVETLIIGGFLTNCCVESTMRTAYEKGFNTITLIDGSACNSKAEQLAAITTTFEMFSTPMKCSEVGDIFKGVAPTQARSGNITMEVDEDLLEKGSDSLFFEEEKSLEEFCHEVFASPFDETVDVATIARQGLHKNETTQIFIMPAGDWTKGLADQVAGRQQMRSCWVRGPYTSPYFVASSFSHSVLMASGIGITPALGVMGQYPGKSKTKILIWSVRSKNMLKFFAPLLSDAHLAAVFYTGKEKLTLKELSRIKSHGNIFVQQSRPRSLVETIASLIVLFEREFAAKAILEGDENTGFIQKIRTMKDIPLDVRETWVLLYCGGSIRIRDELARFAKKADIGWQAELFDW